MQTLWLYLHFPQLQLDLLPQLQADAGSPDWSKPVVLLHQQQLLVKQTNPAAQALGIWPGQSLAHACALCAALQVLPWQPELEQQLLELLAQDCYQLCADLALAPTAALWLRLDPMLQLYGGLDSFLSQLQQLLQQKPGLQFQYGVAVTAEAARLLCLAHPGQIAPTQTAQRLALSPCPVTLLVVTPALLQQLQRLGIRQLGALLNLPATELSRRFGAELQRYLQQIQGQLPPLLHYYQPPEQFCARLELWYQIEHHPQLLAPLRHLLLQLQQYLQRRAQRCFQLQLELSLRDQPPLCLKLHSPQAEALAQRWLALWQLKLETLKLPAPVLAMQLRASQYCKEEQHSADLYQGKQGQYSPLQLVGLLQAKLGAAQVRRPTEHAAFLPELSGSSQPLLQTEENTPASPQKTAQFSIAQRQQPELQQSKVQQPSALYGAAVNTSVQTITRPPQAGSPATFSPTAFSASATPLRPAFLFTTPVPLQQQVQLMPGLERIQSHWWQGQAQARDYLTAQSSDGRWLWLYRTEQQQWFVHGVFA